MIAAGDTLWHSDVASHCPMSVTEWPGTHALSWMRGCSRHLCNGVVALVHDASDKFGARGLVVDQSHHRPT